MSTEIPLNRPTRAKRLKRLTATVGIVAVGASLAACGGGDDASSSDTPGGTVRVLAEDISYTDNWKKHLSEFEEETGIKVKIDTVPYSDMASKILMNFSQKSSAYDVVFNDNVYGTGYYDSKYVEDLTKYAKYGDKYAKFSDYYEPYIAPMTKDGATFGLPVYGESTWLMYRTDLFEEYGIKVPTTMAELEQAAATVKEKSGGKVAGITLRGAAGIQNVYPWAGFLRAYGGDFYADGKVEVDSPEAVEAADFWANLLKKYGPAGVGNFDWEQNRIAFTQGKAAMTIDATANGPFNEDPKASKVVGKVGYAPVPYAISDPPTSGNTDNSLNVHALYLSSFSKNKEAAYTFMAWATGKATQEAALKETAAVGVTLTSVLESPEYAEQFGAFQEPLMAQLKTGNVNYLPSGQDANTVITAVGQALSQALAGEKSPEAALKEAQKSLDQQLGQ